MQERRKSKRKSLAVSLEIYSNDSRFSLGRGFITNLSEGGVAMEIHKDLRLGDRLLLRFSLDKEQAFDLLGEIVYAHDGILTKAYGARFYDLNPDTSDKLKNVIIANSKQ